MDDLTSSLEEMTNRKQMLLESVMKAKVGKEETVSTFSSVSNSSHVKSISLEVIISRDVTIHDT